MWYGIAVLFILSNAASFVVGCKYKEKVLAAKQKAADEIKAIANKL